MKKINKNLKLINKLKTFTFYFLLYPIFLLSIFYFLLSVESASAANDGLSLTVTPPLFQLNIGPGEFWASSIKVANTNPYDLNIYASAVNFSPRGEDGQGSFIPLVFQDEESKKASLAGWINVPADSVLVPKGQTGEIPFSVKIPQDAPPGGHYAAILVGTRPFGGKEDGALISVSSMVSSLFFVSVKGDIIESANIREFRTEKDFYQKPKANFILRLENGGNVHIQPQGDIAIYNMWGKKRGKIFINQQTTFGNVLPKSVRKFSFDWIGEESIFEAGRHKAIATLSYGQYGRQNISAVAYFWIVPVFPILGTLFGLGLILIVLAWGIKAYIKKALLLESEKRGINFAKDKKVFEGEILDSQLDLQSRTAKDEKFNLKILTEPMQEGILDLKTAITKQQESQKDKTRSFLEIISVYKIVLIIIFKKYYKVLIFLLALVALFAFLGIYFGEALIPSRDFEIILRKDGI